LISLSVTDPHPPIRLQTLTHNPLTPKAKAVNKLLSNAMTPTRTTLSTSCTARMSRLNALVSGFRNTSRPARPKIATAAVTVAKISTMMRARRAPTAISWRFSFGWMFSMTSEFERVERVGCVAFAGASSLIDEVVDVMAAVILLICAPTCGIAAIFSRRGDEGERGARVASVGDFLAT